MSSNDQILLKSLLEDARETRDSSLKEDEFFEEYAAELLLAEYDLSYDEVESGIVDGGNDGGIDSVYAIVNGRLVEDDTDVSDLRRDVTLALYITQSKLEKSFREGALEKLTITSSELLDLSRPLDSFRPTYSEKVLAAIGQFRRVYRELLTRHPEVSITYSYVTMGDEIHPNVEKRRASLEQALRKQFSSADVNVQLLGAGDLLNLARRPKKMSTVLTIGAVLPTTSPSGPGFLCLVRLTDFAAFITDERGNLRESMFESNVRDYQGSVQVNKSIRDTLDHPKSAEFWWLNNGITLVASKANLAGTSLSIEDAQIVNGLQTSREIYQHFHENAGVADNRSVLVRILVPDEDMDWDSIIQATNSQTAIPIASLRATETMQRNIETYFKANGYYYDRRKNFYKNQGKPRRQIISIPYLAQAMIAIGLHEPDVARGRASSYLKDDENYNKVFCQDYPMDTYLACVKHMKAIDEFLGSPDASYAAAEKSSVKFHLALMSAGLKGKIADFRPSDVPNLGLETIDSAFLNACLSHVWDVFNATKQNKGLSSEQTAKSQEFASAITNRIREIRSGTIPFE